jgi:prepilin signal peptidase PulO-like enzyme (type II secretory pathway)
MTFQLLLGAAIGLCIGSFLNVVIYRLPIGQSIVTPPSRCRKCGYQLQWYDNIPVLSWLFSAAVAANAASACRCNTPSSS